LNDKQRPVHIKSVYIVLLHSATPRPRNAATARADERLRNDIILLNYGFTDETTVTSKFRSNIEHLVTLLFSSSSHSQVVRITVHYARVTILFNVHVQTDMYPRSFGVAPERYVKHGTALRI